MTTLTGNDQVKGKTRYYFEKQGIICQGAYVTVATSSFGLATHVFELVKRQFIRLKKAIEQSSLIYFEMALKANEACE